MAGHMHRVGARGAMRQRKVEKFRATLFGTCNQLSGTLNVSRTPTKSSLSESLKISTFIPS